MSIELRAHNLFTTKVIVQWNGVSFLVQGGSVQYCIVVEIENNVIEIQKAKENRMTKE